MSQLGPIISETTNWTIIGSSFGGLMGVVFTIDHRLHKTVHELDWKAILA